MLAAYIQVHFRLEFIVEVNTINPDQTALNPLPHRMPFNILQTEQTQIRQLL